MKFWSPKKAAIQRIVDDAIKYYGVEQVKRSVSRAHRAEVNTNVGKQIDSSAQAPSVETQEGSVLSAKLLELQKSDPGTFHRIEEEFSKYEAMGT